MRFRVGIGCANSFTFHLPFAPLFPTLFNLLRKEVIQPHLPIRLPCYDFTPITNPTFDGSAPCGFGHRLRVLPAFVV